MPRIGRVCFASVVTALILAPSAVPAVGATWPSETTPRQINVTADSASGWLPTDAQLAAVRKTADGFFAAEDDGRSADAYGYLADLDRQDQPFPVFADVIRRFNLQAGAVKERRVTTVTWTKNPAQAPVPGVYAALDFVARFADVDRYCGFLILYQPPSGGVFRVMREERDFIDNLTAKQIAQQHSEAYLDNAWAQASAYCPNYIAPPTSLPEQRESTVGYPTVAAALAGLHARSAVEFSSHNGWTIATDNAALTMWSFAPASDPAYPAVVKRQVTHDGGGTDIKTNVLCEASKQACDTLVRRFEQLAPK